ncbi:MAG: alpha-2-macroglobulin family protein [Aggregatilineales bacterium]
MMRKLFWMLIVILCLLILPESPVNHVYATETVGVIQQTPQPGRVDVDSMTQIIVAFDHPVIALSGTSETNDAPNPIEIEPYVEGQGEWVNTFLYVFTPTAPMQPATIHTVSIQPILTAINGNQIEASSWTFTTADAYLLDIDVVFPVGDRYNYRTLDEENRGVLLDDAFQFTFSMAIPPAIGEDSIHVVDAVGEPISGEFEWGRASSQRSQSVIFRPDERLQIDSAYTVEVNDGFLTNDELPRMFHTIPFPSVSRVSPVDNSRAPISERESVTITFATPMNTETLRDRIVVEPSSVEWEPYINSDQSVYLIFTPEQDTVYSVTLLAGAEDVYGNPIESDYSWSFSFGPPTVRVPNDTAYLALNSNFTLLSAGRTPTRLAMVARGINDLDVSFDLYRVVPEDLKNIVMTRGNAQTNRASDRDIYVPPVFEDNDHRIRTGSLVVNGDGDRTVNEIVLNGEDEPSLEPGLYWLRTDEYSYCTTDCPRRTDRRILLGVVNAALTVKRSNGELLVFVTDLVSGAPLPDVTIHAYRNSLQEVTGLTDGDGIARLALPVDPVNPDNNSWWWGGRFEYLLITATRDETFGAWYSDQVNIGTDTRGYLYTDRPIYGAGETVYFRGILRDQDDVTYSPPELNEVDVYLCEYGCNGDAFTDALDHVRLPVSYFGTINGTFTLPEDLFPGEYRIHIDWGNNAFTTVDCQGSVSSIYLYCDSWRSDSVQFTVAAYETPEYEVSATAQLPEVVSGDDFRIRVDANYYSGGGVTDAETVWYWRGQSTRFTYEDYRFSPLNSGSYYGYEYLDGQSSSDEMPLRTGADGSVLIVEPAPELIASVPFIVRFEAAVGQANDRRTASTSFVVHPSSIYVGQRSASRFYNEGDSVEIDLLTVTPAHEVVPNQSVTIQAERISWERQANDYPYGSYSWVEEITPIVTTDLVLDENGTGQFTFQPEVVGTYQVHATTSDAQGRTHTSTSRIYIRGGQISGVGQSSTSGLTIVADQDSYQPGDTAQLLIPTPFEGTMLLTVERAGIMFTDVITITDEGSVLYELPVTFDYAPNITFTATLIGPGENGHVEYSATRTNLAVDFPHRRLFVEVTPSSMQVQPGETVRFDVRVTDRRGRPIRAEVGLALVDDAVLSLRPPNSQTLAETFYAYQSNRVVSLYALDGLADDLTDTTFEEMGGGGGGGGYNGLDIGIEPRTDFITTPLWAPSIITNENGRASVEVTMPDNLTRWHVDARVVSLDTLIGQYETNIVSSQNLIVRPQTPRFLIVGDQFDVSAIIQNNTDEDQTLDVWLESTGINVQSDLTQTVTIPANGQVTVIWAAIAQDVDSVEVTVYAANDTVQDAVQPMQGAIPVYIYSVRDTTATGGMLTDEDEVTETIRIPEQALSGTLDLSLSTSLVQTTFDALESYPPRRYETTDVTTGRLLMNTAAYRALQSQPGRDVALEAQLSDLIEADIVSLIERGNSLFITSGERSVIAWSWLPNFNEDAQLTAYALIALMDAQRLGFSAEALAETIENGCAYFQYFDTLQIDNSLSSTRLDTLALAMYTLGQCDPSTARANKIADLYAYESLMRTSSRAYLILALQLQQPDHPLINTMIDNLLGEAVINANGAYWEDTAPAFYGSNIGATALILEALVYAQSDSPLLPNIVRWLVMAREGTVWQSALETGWSLSALTEYANATGESFPSYTYHVVVGDETLVESAVQTSTSSEQLLIPFDSGESETVNISRDAGDGSLYYTATLDLALPVEETQPYANGITVIREYLDADGQLLEEIRVGQTVFVRLTFVVDQDVFFFQLEDPLPAGFVADDPALLGQSSENLRTARGLSTGDRRWFWSAGSVQQALYLNDRVILRSNYISPGIYTFSYVARATASGTFQAAPSHAFSTRMPDIFGRGSGQIVQISQ